MILWKDQKMLNYNFLNNYKNWGLGLEKINHEMPWKHEDFRKSLNPNTMDAAIWLVEELQKQIEPEKKLDVIVLNSWLGFPLVPLLCENIPIQKLVLIDIDKDALELSKVFNLHYSSQIDIFHENLDIPFAYHDINALNTDVVISLGCETMYPLKNMTTANPDCIFACQSSNVFREMYGINCVPTIEEHIENVGVTNVLYQGLIKQSYYSWDGKVEFDRFMTIGKK